jgi:transposase
MRTISLDLRTRILAVYDEGQSTREEVAKRFRVSLGFVKKLLCQRKRTGSIGARHCFSGRKPKITQEQRKALGELVAGKPDITLAEMKQALGLECTPQAIHYILAAMNLAYKKDAPRQRAGPPGHPRRARALEKRAGAARPRETCFHRRVRGEDEHDAPAGAMRKRQAPARERAARPLEEHDHDQFCAGGRKHREHDGRRGNQRANLSSLREGKTLRATAPRGHRDHGQSGGAQKRADDSAD